MQELRLDDLMVPTSIQVYNSVNELMYFSMLGCSDPDSDLNNTVVNQELLNWGYTGFNGFTWL